MTWMGFNLVDAAVLAFLVGGVIGGIRRGLSGELARVLIAAGCVIAIYAYARPLAEWLGNRHGFDAHIAILSSTIIILLGSYVALTVARLALAALFNFSFKGRPEKIGGAVCGLLRSGFVAMLLLMLFSLLPNDTLHRLITEESRTGRLVTGRVQPLYEKLSEKIPELRAPGQPIDEWAEPVIEDATEVWDPMPLGPVE